MARETKTAPLDGGVPEAMLAMGLHMVESRVSLFGDLATCGSAVEASETISRWWGRRVEEFSADQARLMEAWMTSMARTASLATDTLAVANGDPKPGKPAA
ncbi:hypothetical protein [Elioraea sp.]|uniref:hypothetical protein n=1 Tax=Elioraea sp. TaxID=2185103 RepID=UPI003F6F8937